MSSTGVGSGANSPTGLGEPTGGETGGATHLSLIARDGDGSEVRHILDVAEMTTDVSTVTAAADTARSGWLLRTSEGDVPLFDLRSDPAANGGCLLIGRRGALRLALLVD